MTILFLDDSPEIRSVAKYIFTNKDVNVVVCEDSKSAINLIKYGVDIAVLDLNLGSNNVVDVLKEARKKKLDVYIFSGYIGSYKFVLEEFKDIIKGTFSKPNAILLRDAVAAL